MGLLEKIMYLIRPLKYCQGHGCYAKNPREKRQTPVLSYLPRKKHDEGATMTPTMEEVAGWLRQAGKISLPIGHLDSVTNQIFLTRAAQVEAMGILKTCDTCEYWGFNQILRPDQDGTNFCGLPPVEGDAAMGFEWWGDCCALYCGPKFGCVHHKGKLQLPVKK